MVLLVSVRDDKNRLRNTFKQKPFGKPGDEVFFINTGYSSTASDFYYIFAKAKHPSVVTNPAHVGTGLHHEYYVSNDNVPVKVRCHICFNTYRQEYYSRTLSAENRFTVSLKISN